MDWLLTRNGRPVRLNQLPSVRFPELRDAIIGKGREGRRPVGFFGMKTADGVRLFAVLADDRSSALELGSALFGPEEKSYDSISREIPAFHNFEREFFEEFAIRPEGHPWLKPLRYSHDRANKNDDMNNYPFFQVAGDTVHQVAVGPVHAGVIEPGHFRFMCDGEKVHHLEIQLGYQHRGVENLLLQGDIRTRSALVESISGDSAIANTWTYAAALEALSGREISLRDTAVRTIALEMERTALHLSSLSGIATDIGYLPGSTFFGATRTYVINALLALCGSRFGRGLIRPGGVRFDIDAVLAADLKRILLDVRERIEIMADRMFDSPSVLSRLQGTGTISRENAAALGMAGVVARASGVKIDVRADHPFGMFMYHPVYILTMESGDVFARAFMRYLESLRSLDYQLELLYALPESKAPGPMVGGMVSDALAVTMTEGPRGEIVHVCITGKDGEIVRYKLKDPSFNNWYGLALAVRGEGISDFPLCNKSFDLSYCGVDL